MEAYSRFILRHPWLVILASLFVVALAISGTKNLRFTNDYRYFFSEQNPYLNAFEELEKTYSSPDTILYVLQHKTDNATSPEALALIGDITEQGWQIPFSTRVDSITNFQNTRAIGDDLEVRDLVVEPNDVDAATSQYVEDVILAEPLLVNRLLAPDKRTSAILVSMRAPRDDQIATTSIVTKAREIQAQMREKYPDFKIELTGSQMLSNAFSEAAQGDIKTLTPLMFLIIAVVLYVTTRSVFGLLGAMITITLSTFAAIGTAAWFGIPMSPPASGAPTIILTVAVADCVHILISTLVAQGNGKSKHDAIAESLKVNAQPVFLTSITTAIGLFSLNFSDSPPYQDLGNISAFGALFAWFLAMTLFPAILSLLPLKANSTVAIQSGFMERIADTVIRHRRALMVGMIIVTVSFTALLPRLTFNDRFVEYFDSSTDFRVASDWAADNLSGIYILNFSLDSGDVGGISDPNYLQNIDNFSQWMRSQTEVKHVASFSDIIKRINKSMNGDNPNYYRVPESRELAAQYLLLYEMSLPYGLDMNDQINIDKSASRVIVTLSDVSTQDIKELRARTIDWMNNNGLQDTAIEPAGQAVMFAYIGERNLKAMTSGTIYAFLLISVCLIIALRSLRLGLISLLPNMAPPAVAMGIFSLINTEVGFWTSFVTATAIGLIVDATVHILSKYRYGRIELGYDSEQAVRYSFQTVGTALWVASIILIAGFLVLSNSPFLINAMLGLVVSITILVALILDFLLLPPLLIALDGRRSSEPPAPQSSLAE